MILRGRYHLVQPCSNWTGRSLVSPFCVFGAVVIYHIMPLNVNDAWERPLMPEEPLLLRIDEAAALLSISRSAMYLYIAEGTIPTIKIGRSRRVVRSDLIEWVERLGSSSETS